MLTKSLWVDLRDLARWTEAYQFGSKPLKRVEALDSKSDCWIREELGSLQVVGNERRFGNRDTMATEGVVGELRAP